MNIIKHIACALLCLPVDAMACGLCIEDKMAATYDHAMVMQAYSQGHSVAFVDMQTVANIDEALTKKIVRTLEAATAVDRGSVRVSIDPATASFAFDAHKVAVEDILTTVNRGLTPQMELVLIRTVNKQASR